MSPYKIVDRTENSITYEYRTIYTWILCGALVIVVWGHMTNQDSILIVGWVSIITLFALKLTIGRSESKEIKNALKNGMVEFSGSKYSFKNPIRIKIPKTLEQRISGNRDSESLPSSPRV